MGYRPLLPTRYALLIIACSALGGLAAYFIRSCLY